MSNHTPGPWHVVRENTYVQFGTTMRIRDNDDSVVAGLHVNDDANGRLIAAAPDLLNMLTRLVDEATSNSVCLLTLEQARQAINKASRA